ncbi:hypothetical protein [Salininema proteolyticum]|uniref:Integral membrane protein n=1 Tax=Salininema proteolyticum TaxID=1607685 RepID=A0ABV8TW15_9ACTN
MDREDLVELRVHGVSGTPPSEMLGDPHPFHVAGDTIGRIFRRRTPSYRSLSNAAVQGRTVEAFHWGNYTAGSRWRVLWLLMVPFSLMNLARFAQLQPKKRTPLDKWSDAVLRLLGLVLTAVLVVTACYISWEVIARQCSGEACGRGLPVLDWFARQDYPLRFLIAAAVPALLILSLWFFGRSSFSHDPPGARRDFDPAARNGSLEDSGFWRANISIVQRLAHIWASTCLVGLIALAAAPPGASGHSWYDPARAVAWWVLSIGLAGAVLTVVLNPNAVVNKIKRRDGFKVYPKFEARPLRIVQIGMLAALAAALTAVWLVYMSAEESPDAPVPLVGEIINRTGVATAVLLVVIAADCLVYRLAPVGRRHWGEDVPRDFRPFWHGFGPWVLSSVAVLVGYGFSAAGVYWSAQVFASGGDIAAGFQLAAAIWGLITVVVFGALLVPALIWLLRNDVVAVLWAVVALVSLVWTAYAGIGLWLWFGVLTAAGLVVAWWATRSTRREFLDEVANDYGHSDETGAPTRAARLNQAKVSRAWWAAMARYRYHHVLGLVAALGGVSTILAGYAGVRVSLSADPDGVVDMWRSRFDLPSEYVLQTGAVAVSVIGAGLVLVGLLAWRRQSVRTSVGTVWDLVSFWPRMGHPLTPPPYGERAVIGVAERCSQLANVRLLNRRESTAGAVVLSGHSQGAVISMAVAALLDGQASREDAEKADEDEVDWLRPARARAALDKLHLLTYGSQLKFIYARLLPAYLGYEKIREVYRPVLSGRWRNIYRWTDPLGAPVLSWTPEGVPSSRHGPLVDKWRSFDDPEPVAPVRVPTREGEGEFTLWHYHWKIGPDVRFRDPDIVTDSAYRARLDMRGHGSYPDAAVFDLVVADLIGEPGGAENRRGP